MTVFIVLLVALLIALLVVVPTWVVWRDLRSGSPDPGGE